MSAERLDHMRDHFRAEVERNSAAGYVLMVARAGKLVYSAAIGMRDRAQRQPMTLDTRFRIASMTKPVTAVAVLMLYEEGRFISMILYRAFCRSSPTHAYSPLLMPRERSLRNPRKSRSRSATC